MANKKVNRKSKRYVSVKAIRALCKKYKITIMKPGVVYTIA